jgi:hypothetical protein
MSQNETWGTRFCRVIQIWATRLPDDQRVALLEGLEAAEQGRALRRRAGDPLVLEDGLASGFLQSRELQGGILIVGRDAGVAVFHAPIMALTYDPRKPLKTGQGSGGSKLTL